MRSFQGKSGWKKITEWPPFLIFLSILVLIFAWNVLAFFGKMWGTVKNSKIAESQVVELRQNQKRLEMELSRLETEEGVEAALREKYAVAKPGEGVIIVVDEPEDLEANAERGSHGFFGFFKKFFKKEKEERN